MVSSVPAGSQPSERRHQLRRQGQVRCRHKRAGRRGGPAARRCATTGSAAYWAGPRRVRHPDTAPESGRPASRRTGLGSSADRPVPLVARGSIGALLLFGTGGQIGRPSRARWKRRAGTSNIRLLNIRELHPVAAGGRPGPQVPTWQNHPGERSRRTQERRWSMACVATAYGYADDAAMARSTWADWVIQPSLPRSAEG